VEEKKNKMLSSMKQCLQEKVTAFSKQIELQTDGLYNSDDEKD
tara:strand:- start:650 stop:778 length:129 start_codon:yes stop_codon:yes gene_type:complete